MSSLLPLVSPEQAIAWLQSNDAVILDVRSPAAWRNAHVMDSVHAPLEQLTINNIKDIKQERIILLCQTGAQATQASRTLQVLQQEHNDHSSLYVLDGGLTGWRKARLPLVYDDQKGLPLERQVQLLSGLIILVSLLFTLIFSGLWLVFPIALGAALIYAGATGWMGLQDLVLLLPWNRDE